jgi:hypothetical protein
MKMRRRDRVFTPVVLEISADFSPADEEYENKEEDSQQQDDGGQSWNSNERIRFKKALMLFGYGRWRKIKEAAEINR